jgi:hypothetical protein
MTPDERKAYNLKYYQTNKTVIMQKALAKVPCELCESVVIQNNLAKHQQTKLCNKRQRKNYYIKQRLGLPFDTIDE